MPRAASRAPTTFHAEVSDHANAWLSPDTLDSGGTPIWISALADETPNLTLHVVSGLEPGTSAALLAGRIGGWTFVYDDSMATDHENTPSLSANGRSAATSMFSVFSGASLTYAVSGEQIAGFDVNDLDLEADLPGMPADLRAAFEAAGIFQLDGDAEPGWPDHAICMRAVCALAGLTCTVSDLRRIPLLVTAFG